MPSGGSSTRPVARDPPSASPGARRRSLAALPDSNTRRAGSPRGLPAPGRFGGWWALLPLDRPRGRLHDPRLHLDVLHLGLGGLRDLERQHAVLEDRLGLVGLESLRKRQRAFERPDPQLAAVILRVLAALLRLELAGDGQGVAVDAHVNVVRLDAREGRLDDELVRG